MFLWLNRCSFSGKNSSERSFTMSIVKPKAIKAVVVKLFIYTVKGNVGSKILAITPQASASVGIRKNIQAKLTSRKVTMILTLFPNQP